MKQQVIQCIQELFECSCIELFESLRCSIKRVHDVSPDLSAAPIARINAESPDIDVYVFLQIPFSALALSYPLAGDMCEIDEVKLEDWALELANQLLGRFKSKMDKHACHIEMGLPDSKFGIEINSLLPDCTHCFCEHFELDNTLFRAYSCLTLHSETPAFSLEEIAHNDIMDEGDIELF